MTRHDSAVDLLCPRCGYDLRGPTSGRCPECGLTTPDEIGLRLDLPWVHRRAVGRVRAYLRTAALAAFQPGRLAANVARPVARADAVAFRRVTAAVVTVAVSAVATAAAFLPETGPLTPALREPRAWWAELLCVPVAWVGVGLTFLTATGVAEFAFYTRRLPLPQRNRAAALSLYACGPLIGVAVAMATVIPVLLSERGWGILELGDSKLWVIGGVASALVLVAVVLWTRSTAVVLRRTTECGLGRQLFLIACLPVAWVTLTATFCVGLPAAYVWLVIVIKSLA